MHVRGLSDTHLFLPQLTNQIAAMLGHQLCSSWQSPQCMWVLPLRGAVCASWAVKHNPQEPDPQFAMQHLSDMDMCPPCLSQISAGISIILLANW